MKVLVIVLLASSVSTLGKQLPSYIQPCKGSDPDYSGCIKKAMTSIQPHLSTGIKELNIPPLEPLVVPMVKLEQGTAAINYKANINDVKLYGLTQYKVKELMADYKTKTFLLKMDLPKVDIVADYDIKGNVLILPIQGNGELTANLTDCKADIMLLAGTVQKKGKEYVQAKEVKTILHFGPVKANFDNLFNGDSLLGMTTNMFLNENAKDILTEIKPAVEAVTNMLSEDIINKVFRSLPASELFPQ